MSTSPRSEYTVLLWGQRWWIAGTQSPVAFGRVAEAAGALARVLLPNPLRLIYQPDSLESIEVTCPKGDRQTLHTVLSLQVEALKDPATAWSYEPIVTYDSVHSTLLHWESTPQLFDLVTQLTALGFTIVSAWPLATFLHALRGDGADAEWTSVVAADHDHACGYRALPGGTPTVRTWTGETTAMDVARWLCSNVDGEDDPTLIVTAGDGFTAELEAFDGIQDRAPWKVIKLTDALERDVDLPNGHSAQLLPPPPPFTQRRVVLAATASLLVVNLGLGVLVARDAVALWSHGLPAPMLSSLRADILRLRANAAEIDRTDAEPSLLSVPVNRILDRLASATPKEIVLQSLLVNSEGVTLKGHTAPGLAAGTLETWAQRAALGPLSVSPPALDGAFVAKGAVNP